MSYDYTPDDRPTVSDAGVKLDFIPEPAATALQEPLGVDANGEVEKRDPVALVSAGYCPYCDTVKFVTSPAHPISDQWRRLRSHIVRVHPGEEIPQPKV